MNRKVSIIIPIIRPESARRCMEGIRENAGVSIDQYEVVTAVDTEGIGCPEMVKMLVQKTKHNLVCFLGDDTVPQEDFLKNALREMHDLPDGWGVVGLNSGQNPYAHWLAHKNILEHIEGGNFFSTDYAHCWGDAELRDIAEDLGRWAYAEDSIIEHYHPIFDTADWDDGYAKAYSKENRAHDQKTYHLRKRARMEKKYGTRLAIAQPLTFDMVHSQFHFSFLGAVTTYMQHLFESGNPICLDMLSPEFPGQIDAVRNNLTKQAIYNGSTHIIFMDTDQVYFDADVISRLMDHGKKIVGARVHRRYPPFDPIMFRGELGGHYSIPDEELDRGGLIEVNATGAGCILFDTRVFMDMPTPWFKLDEDEDGRPIGEDINFCARLKDKGHKIYVDSDIDIKHLSLLSVDMGTYKLFKKLVGRKTGTEVKKNGICK